MPAAPQEALEEVEVDHDHDPYHDDPYHHDEHHHDEYDEYHDEYYHQDHDHGGDYVEHAVDHHHDSPSRSPDFAVATSGAARAVRKLISPGDGEEEGDFGGPVKPFLDHLEDLRWMLIKCVLSLLLAMLACMMGAKHLVAFLSWPLKQAEELGMSGRKEVPLMLDATRIGKVPIEQLVKIGWDTNAPIFTQKNGVIRIAPVTIGTNTVLSIVPQVPNSDSKKEPVVLATILKNYGPFESIWLCLQLALYGGLVIGAPFIIFFVAEFVLPALKVTEKKFLYKATGIGTVLFFLGVTFCYLLIVQVALKASVEFSLWLGFAADEWKAGDYISFVVKFLLVMGLAFEMPVVLLTIVKIGLLDHQKLTEFRSYFFVGMLVTSAVITPSGDPFTMVLVAIPLWILYEICVIIARMWEKKAKEAAAAEERGEAAGS